MGGKLSVLQPEAGFRAGLDSVLLGASVPPQTRKLLDLGAGAGVAGLTALAHNPALEAVLAEIDPQTADLARENIAANRFTARTRVLTLDILAPGNIRKAAGLSTDLFDTVIANPPFFSAGTLAPDAARAGARHMDKGDIEGWVRTAVSCAHAQGMVIFIHAAEALPQLLAALDKRVGGIVVQPLGPRPGLPASRVLIRGQKGSRAPLTLLPHLALHGADGHGFAPRFDAIFRGAERFDWQRDEPVPISGLTSFRSGTGQ